MIHHGDLFDVLPTLDADSIDACVTDPPYDLTANKRGGSGEASLNLASPAGRSRISTGGGFMGKEWDGQGVAFKPETWREVRRVLKPGAYVLAFGGTRTFHRMTCAIEDAGFEIRDCLSWLYGQGFPKSLNLPGGRGTALKPSWEPIILARKPTQGTVAQNVEKHGTGALNIDACRIDGNAGVRVNGGGVFSGQQTRPYIEQANTLGQPFRDIYQTHDMGRWPANVLLDEWHEPLLYLKYNTPTDAAHVIREYFDGYSGVHPVRDRVRDVPDQSEAGESSVLQACLLRSVAEREQERPEPPHEGPASSAGLDQEDARFAESQEYERREQPSMEGRQAYLERICDGDDLAVVGEGAPSICANGEAEQQSLHPRASTCGGSEVGQALDGSGDCASSEREQTRQPIQQFRDARQRHAQAEPSGNRQRTQATAPRERTIEIRTLEVLESDIPRGWLIYFAPTGKTVRRGAAAILDEQAGPSISRPVSPDRLAIGSGDGSSKGIFGMGSTVQSAYYDSFSGVSRFFYCAKPSREERDYGCQRLPEVRRTDGRQSEHHVPNLRTTSRSNHHPTVKPVELMRWLVRLVTPIGGIVLDPFTGSGTTGMACRYEQRAFIGIEREAEYVAIAEARIASVAPLFGAVQQQTEADVTAAEQAGLFP